MFTSTRHIALAAGLIACLAPSLDAQKKKSKPNPFTDFTRLPLATTWQPQSSPVWIDIEGSNVQIRVQSNGEVQVYVNGKLRTRRKPGSLGQPLVVKDAQGKARAKVRTAPRYVPTKRASLGVQVTKLSAALASHLDLDVDDGVLVQTVTKNGAAQKAGLRRHDVIVGLGNSGGITSTKLSRILGKHKPGDKIAIRYLRGGKIRETQAKLGSTNVFSLQWNNTGYLLNQPFYFEQGAKNYRSSFRLNRLPAQTSRYGRFQLQNDKQIGKETGKKKTGKKTGDKDAKNRNVKTITNMWSSRRDMTTPFLLPQASLKLDFDDRSKTLEYFDFTSKQLQKSNVQLQKNNQLWTQVNKQLKTKSPRSSEDLEKIRSLLKELEAKNRRIDRLLDRLEKIGKIR